MHTKYSWTVPSEKKEELEYLIQNKIVCMMKTSYETYEDYLDYLDQVGIYEYRDRTSFFKYSYGGVMLRFDDGSEYSFGSAEDLNSVIMSCQKDSFGKKNEKYILDDKDILSLDSVLDIDYEYKNIMYKKIVEINSLTTEYLSSKEQSVPSEKGIEFLFENGNSLILAHNLTGNNFVFAVLSGYNQIAKKVIVKFKVGSK